MDQNGHILRHHHMTLCVGGAQEDYDFHTKVLGLKSVKKTALFDGTEPIHHLYYGNDLGDVGTLITCFPMRQSGRRGRPGTGQISAIAMAVPQSALDFWERHLSEHGFAPERRECFGETSLHFHHPCGIAYALTGAADDDRTPYSNGVIPSAFGIRGTHGITVAVRDVEDSDEFMRAGWNSTARQTDGAYVRHAIGAGGSGALVDFHVLPDTRPGTWTFGEGTVHHCAFQVADHTAQDAVKAHLEGLGYTDVSDVKDRGYFDSVYVRTPGGALFEATVSKPEGFLIDETYAELGTTIQIPPPFRPRQAEMLAYLEPIAG